MRSTIEYKRPTDDVGVGLEPPLPRVVTQNSHQVGSPLLMLLDVQLTSRGLDAENRLRLRRVEVLRRTRETVLVRSGIAAGERICTSPLSVSVDGMLVRTVEDPGSSAELAEARSQP